MAESGRDEASWQRDYPDWAREDPFLAAARAANAPGSLGPEEVDRLAIQIAFHLEALGRALFVIAARYRGVKERPGVDVDPWDARAAGRFLARHQPGAEARALLDRALCVLRRGLDEGAGVRIEFQGRVDDEATEGFRSLTRLALDPGAFQGAIEVPEPPRPPAAPSPAWAPQRPPYAALALSLLAALALLLLLMSRRGTTARPASRPAPTCAERHATATRALDTLIEGAPSLAEVSDPGSLLSELQQIRALVEAGSYPQADQRFAALAEQVPKDHDKPRIEWVLARVDLMVLVSCPGPR